MLSISQSLPSSFKGRTAGLTGLFDGDPTNDLTWRNGSGYLSNDASEEEIFYWASTCESDR